MRKIFTFVICALAAVSLNATTVEIGTETVANANVPISIGNIYYALSQQVYLKKEFIGVTSGDEITSIKFHYASANSACTRTWEIYINATTNSDMPSGDHFVACGTKVFDGEVTLPATADWFEIPITAYEWQGGNIVLTVYDKTSNKAFSFPKNFYATSAKWRGMATSAGLGSDPYDISNITSIEGLYIDYIPNVIFIFGGGDEPEPVTTPTITVSGAELDFGSYYPAAETVSKTFKITASDLTNDITLSTTAKGVTINPTSIEQDNADLAGAGVEVTVTLGSGYAFPIINPAVSVASTGATSKSVTLKATEVRDTDFSTKTLNFVSSNGYYTIDGNVTIQSINTTDKSMSIKASNTTKNANYTLIDSQETFAVGGKFSGLKGKYEDEVFKIFSYTSYTAPTPTSVVEVDEDVDHSTDWTDIEDGENVNMLTIKRTFVPNEWNSIVLPTHLTSTEVENIFGSCTDLEEFTNAVVTSSNITLNFTKKTNGLEAGVPYLIKPTQAIANPLNLTNRNFKKTITPVEKNGIEFTGVLVPTTMDASGDDYIFVGANNTLFHPEGAGTIKGMRAYFHVVGETAKAAIKKSPMISLSTGSTTAMTLVKSDAEKSYKAIENGRIVINVNEKKVNVLGQIVK